MADAEGSGDPAATPNSGLHHDSKDLVCRLTQLLGEMDVDALARTVGEALFKAKGAGDAEAE